MESGRKNIPNLKCVLMEVKLLNDLDKSAPFPRVCICPSFAMHRGYVLRIPRSKSMKLIERNKTKKVRCKKFSNVLNSANKAELNRTLYCDVEY